MVRDHNHFLPKDDNVTNDEGLKEVLGKDHAFAMPLLHIVNM
jgi:hypothetical protein